MFIPKDVLVFDFETSGLCYPKTHPTFSEPHELGAVLIDRETLEVVDEFHVEFGITHPEFASPEAFKLSTIKLEDVVKRTKTFAESIQEFDTHFFKKRRRDSVRLAAFNVSFDMSFLRQGYIEAGLQDNLLKFDHHLIDIWLLYDTFRFMMDKRDLLWGVKQALQELDLQEEANNFSHRGLDDCRAEAKILQYVYKALVPETVEA